jgi:hypothetical protein
MDLWASEVRASTVYESDGAALHTAVKETATMVSDWGHAINDWHNAACNCTIKFAAGKACM